MMRITYRNKIGDYHIEDLLGPSSWSTVQYRQAFQRQHPGATIVGVKPVRSGARIPPSKHPDITWAITLRIPGKPLRTVHQTGSRAEAYRLALSSAEAPAQIVRMIPLSSATA